MRTFSAADAVLNAASGIHIGRWSQYEGVAALPFQAMWCVIPPASASAPDQHPEVELAVVMAGRATFDVDGREVAVSAGTAVLLESGERHVIHNAAADEPVRILSVYWMPEEPETPPEGAGEPPVTVVLSPPPTPNGPLHVGHLAGPYVAADVAVRAGRARGEPTISVCGLDDNQNYVVAAARARGRDAEELRRENAGRIRSVFTRLGIGHDIFTEPTADPRYRSAVVRLLDQSVTAGMLPVQEWTLPYCEPCGGSLHHAYVAGRCAGCGAGMNGGTCEGCGAFHTAGDLVEPRCTRCGAPPSGQLRGRGPVLPLADHRDHLMRVWCQATLPPRVRRMVDRLLDKGLPTVPLTYPTDWGIPVADGHRLDAWAEMGLGYLYSVGRQLDSSAVSLSDHLRAWRSVGSLWAFLGLDNAFYYAVLFPGLFAAWGLPPELLGGLVVNEFYTLDGDKFSTSRDHAVWAEELLAEYPPDVVRAFLCLDRPEPYATDFTRERFERVTGNWPRPLRAGEVSPADAARVQRSLAYDSFALAQAARCLLGTDQPGDGGRAGQLLTMLTGVEAVGAPR
jgi:methionyl-tRNA synthetase